MTISANELAARLREGIAAGEYPYGTRLPSVRDLAEEHGVSQQTASAAYTTLAALGLVNIAGGRGGTTVSAGQTANAHLGTFAPPDLAAATAWTPRSEDARATEETTLVRQVAASAEMSEWGIPEGTDVVERTRIRSLDDVPVQHKMTVIPYELAARVPEGGDGPPMLAPVGAEPVKPPAGTRVSDWLGWDVARTESAITAEPMSPAASEALRMTAGAPGFRIVARALDSKGATVFVTITTAPLHHRVTLDIIG